MDGVNKLYDDFHKWFKDAHQSTSRSNNNKFKPNTGGIGAQIQRLANEKWKEHT